MPSEKTALSREFVQPTQDCSHCPHFLYIDFTKLYVGVIIRRQSLAYDLCNYFPGNFRGRKLTVAVDGTLRPSRCHSTACAHG